MAISFSNQNIEFSLPDQNRVKEWISTLIKRHGMSVGNIGYLFCDDSFLLEANNKYLNHDTLTDIITFDYVNGNLVSGDIMISVERVSDNSVTFGVPFTDELHRVIIHGVLHLLGQGDKTDDEARIMRQREDEALALWKTIT
jgi:rRNA maturation RNase YbeY